MDPKEQCDPTKGFEQEGQLDPTGNIERPNSMLDSLEQVEHEIQLGSTEENYSGQLSGSPKEQKLEEQLGRNEDTLSKVMSDTTTKGGEEQFVPTENIVKENEEVREQEDLQGKEALKLTENQKGLKTNILIDHRTENDIFELMTFWQGWEKPKDFLKRQLKKFFK